MGLLREDTCTVVHFNECFETLCIVMCTARNVCHVEPLNKRLKNILWNVKTCCADVL